MVMVRFLAALLLAFVLLAVAQESNAAEVAPSEAEEFWSTVLPGYQLPDALLWYLQADTKSESIAEGTSAGDDTSGSDNADISQRLSRPWTSYYSVYGKKGPSSPKPAADDIVERLSRQLPYYFYTYSNKGQLPHNPATVAVETTERLSRQWPYVFLQYFSLNSKKRSPSTHKSAARSSGDDKGHSHMLASGDRAKMNMSAVFFHEEMVQVGQTLPFYFPPARRAPLGMLPRDVADSFPFSTPALPDILALLGVPAGSPQAADMETTLSMCEAPSPAGEPQFCANSLEALVEGAMAVLGSHGIRPVTSMVPRAGAPWQPYAIRAVRPEVGSRFVSCHAVVYPYTVYRCHDTGPARLYMVKMEGARDGGIVDMAVVCHTDTSQWDPEHLSFKLLGTKPGGAPVCHVMPYGHIVWASNGGDRSS